MPPRKSLKEFIDNNDSAVAIIDSIYQRSLTYDDLRYLFIGIFSRTPSNLFDYDRSAILTEEISSFYNEDNDGENLFESLFTIQLAATRNIEKLQKIPDKEPAASQIYQRFFKDNASVYRAFLTILACCAVTGLDISLTQNRYEVRKKLLENTISIIENDIQYFDKIYREAFKIIIFITPKNLEEDAVKQRLWDFMKKQNFTRLLHDLTMSLSISGID